MRIKAAAFAVDNRDYERAKDYFRRLLGVEPQEEILKFPQIKVARFERDGCVFEVMTPAGDRSHILPFVKEKGGGIVSITVEGLEVEGLDVPLGSGGFLAPDFLKGAIIRVL